ncbi:MAG TPA: hypothetical protein VFG13_19685 [Blastococcus sp.]|nr:hypothetical protein [Blastococcus sp.]
MVRQPPPGRAFRRFTLGSGPLKRTSDRFEFLSRVLLTAVLLATVAIALAVATATYSGGRSEVAREAAERYRVSARLLEEAATPAGSGNGVDVGRAPAVWSAPSGAERSGPVLARLGAEAGSTVLIWVDRDGARTTRPLSTGDVVGRALAAAVLTYLGIAAVAVGGHLAVRRLLDRSRYRRWAAEWALVGPVWTGRVP